MHKHRTWWLHAFRLAKSYDTLTIFMSKLSSASIMQSDMLTAFCKTMNSTLLEMVISQKEGRRKNKYCLLPQPSTFLNFDRECVKVVEKWAFAFTSPDFTHCSDHDEATWNVGARLLVMFCWVRFKQSTIESRSSLIIWPEWFIVTLFVCESVCGLHGINLCQIMWMSLGMHSFLQQRSDERPKWNRVMPLKIEYSFVLVCTLWWEIRFLFGLSSKKYIFPSQTWFEWTSEKFM